ncbi:MAG: TetR/AcrR family transcriptional regulator [Kofleriaceae bacterium]
MVAAVDHLAEMRAAELKVLAAGLPDGRSRTDAVLDLLWQCFSGTFFQVAMELRTAARTDPELRTVLVAAERSLRDRIVAQARKLFGKDVSDHPGLERAIDFTLQFMIGAAMTSVLHEDARLDLLIEDFKILFPTVLNNAVTGPKPKKTPKVAPK